MDSENDKLVAPWILLCDERAKRIAELERKLAVAREALRDISDNWDCRYVEGDRIRGHSPCQHCAARKALEEIK